MGNPRVILASTDFITKPPAQSLFLVRKSFCIPKKNRVVFVSPKELGVVCIPKTESSHHNLLSLLNLHNHETFGF